MSVVDTIIPEGKSGGRPRSIDVQAVVSAILFCFFRFALANERGTSERLRNAKECGTACLHAEPS
jgi:hypothetical protein